MRFSREQEKKLLIALCAVLVLLIVYRVFNVEPPKTAPLTYTRGAVAGSPVRQGLSYRSAGTDPLNIFLARRDEKYPGVTRDIFRMENPALKPKPAPQPVVTTLTPTAPEQTHEKTPERIAEDLSRADLSKFRFLGYLTEKDNTLFLSKDGELFMVKSGDTILKNYKIKEAGKDSVILLDTITRVEVRVELSGSEPSMSPPPSPIPQPRFR